MLLITSRKRRPKQSGPTPAQIAQTPAAQLQALSDQLWAGEITKPEHDTKQAAILDQLQARHM